MPTSVIVMTTTAPFGSWESPITAQAVTKAGLKFGDVLRVDGGDVYWVESRPSESGRSVIVRHSPAGDIDDIGPDDFNARTRVHEYGGGAYVVTDGTVFASRFDDQRLYRIDPEGEPVAIVPEPTIPSGLRYADLDVADDWAVGVHEIHGDGEPANQVVRIDLIGNTKPVIVASGRDFYSSPRINPARTAIAWLEWDHPNMPWDGTDLCMAHIDGDGNPSAPVLVAGGVDESITQPEWAPDGALHYVSDRTGWWNIYRHTSTEDVAVVPMAAEFGQPAWVFATRRYCFLEDGTLLALHGSPDGDHLIAIEEGITREIDVPFRSLGSSMASRGRSLYLIAGGPDTSPAVVEIDVDTGAHEVVRAADTTIDDRYVSIPEQITFDTPDGPTHALFYPPTNPDFRGPEGETPPLIVEIHGGPTGKARTTLNPSYLFWTSRGFGIVDVDYGGSSGYGRAYRNRLRGNWGVVDVRDCALAAAHLAAIGRADPVRLIITGGSAGGYTTLMALATRDEFAAGSSWYGVASLEALAEHTHKFEARYLDRLVGPYPEERALYQERSALNHLDGFSAPIILLQGLDDEVVPPQQTEMMRDALTSRGVPVACIMFEGEGHGFRDARNQITALQSELSFFGQVLGFEPAGDIPPVEIVGL
ncbi:MAG: prolyl oligopeptidase family serine peptidase [Acidimicrobiia bacterium]